MEQYNDKLAEEYWINQVTHYGQFPQLPLCRQKQHITPARLQLKKVVPESCMTKLKQRCKDDWHNIYSFILSAFEIVVSRYTGRDKFLLLLPLQETSFILGADISVETPFKSLFTENRNKLLATLKHTAVSIENVKRKLQAKSKEDIFLNSVIFLYGAAEPVTREAALICAVYPGTDGGAMVSVSFAPGTYEQTTVKELLESFVLLLTAVTEDPGKRIIDYPVLSSSQQQQLAGTFNSWMDGTLLPDNINDVFTEQVQRYPQHIALVDNGRIYTYTELNDKVIRLARLLQETHRPALAAPVVIMQLETIHFVTAVLGILKAGGAFIVPENGQWQTRVVKEASPQLVITDSRGIFNDLPVGLDLMIIDLELPDAGNSDVASPSFSQSSHLAFILPTGTGNDERGIRVTHRNVTSLLIQGNDAVCMQPDDKVICMHPPGSGIYIFTLLQALLSGAAFVQQYTAHNDPAALIENENITIVAAGSEHFVKPGSSIGTARLRTIIVNTLDDCHGLTKTGKHPQVYYLHTEGAVGYMQLVSIPDGKDNGISVKPVGSTSVGILDKNRQLLPERVEGDIYLLGHGVAAGYLADKERPATGFYEHPFNVGEYMFKTGDTGSRWPDGTIVYTKVLQPVQEIAADTIVIPAGAKDIHLFMTLCRQALGISAISLTDNFFTIGGDSIKAIGLISALSKMGYELDMKDIFSARTIGKIASCIQPARRLADQSVITGRVPLTPIQQKFFSFSMPRAHFFNQAFMFRYTGRWTSATIENVFTKIQLHHDALRMTYHQEGGKMVQVNQGTECSIRLITRDFRNEIQPAEALQEVCNTFHQDIDLAAGPLMKVGLFHLTDGDRLLISIHHLVVDVVSWKIIFEDLHHLLFSGEQDMPLELPAKTDPFGLWSSSLEAYAADTVLLQEKTYWSDVLSGEHQPLNKDDEQGTQLVKDITRQGITLSVEDTAVLTRQAGAFDVSLNEMLIASLGMAVFEYFGSEVLLIDLEKHGREPLFDNLNISRTVGWFTSVFPFKLERAESILEQVKKVSEQFRAVPNGGIGYGVLKYLTPDALKADLLFHDTADISFNYLGELLQGGGTNDITIAPEYVGDTLDPELKVPYALDVSGVIMNKSLSLTVAYSEKQYQSETIRCLLDILHGKLTSLLSKQRALVKDSSINNV